MARQYFAFRLLFIAYYATRVKAMGGNKMEKLIKEYEQELKSVQSLLNNRSNLLFDYQITQYTEKENMIKEFLRRLKSV